MLLDLWLTAFCPFSCHSHPRSPLRPRPWPGRVGSFVPLPAHPRLRSCSRTCLTMNGVNDPPLFIKDIKPGLKNLNVVFIVLEIGKWGPQPGSHPPRSGQEGSAPPLPRAGSSPPPPPRPRGPVAGRARVLLRRGPGTAALPLLRPLVTPEVECAFWKSSLSNTPLPLVDF